MDVAHNLIFLIVKDSEWKKRNVNRVLTSKEKNKENILSWEVRAVQTSRAIVAESVDTTQSLVLGLASPGSC